MASDYCYSREMQTAMKRHERVEASVIPIILRAVHWQETPFGKLQALPKDGKPITSPGWHNQDEAFFDVTEGLRKVIKTSMDNSTRQEIVSPPVILSSAKLLPRKDISVLCCYARRDKPFLNYLKTHMAPIMQICSWKELDIRPENTEELNKYLHTAQIVLPMLSAEFLSLDYAYSEEMQNAIKRHERGEAHMLPVYLKLVDFHESPFGGLQVLPSNEKPVSSWNSMDEALVSVVVGIRNAINKQLATS
jgi:hypothetical protein